VPIASVTFFDLGHNGMFDLDFVGGTIVSIYGADVGNIGSGNTITTPGAYSVTAAMNDGPASAAGGDVISISPVPLPGALTLFGAGLVGLGMIAWGKGHRKAA